MQDRDGLFGRQRKASVEKKCSKGKTESKGLKRVWRSRKEEGLVGKDMGERIKSPSNTREGLEQKEESEMKLCH